MDEIPAGTARRCLAEVGGADAPPEADSSGTEITWYEQVERPDRKARDFTEKPQKVYWKYHIMAVLGLQIILAAMATPGNVNRRDPQLRNKRIFLAESGPRLVARPLPVPTIAPYSPTRTRYHL